MKPPMRPHELATALTASPDTKTGGSFTQKRPSAACEGYPTQVAEGTSCKALSGV